MRIHVDLIRHAVLIAAGLGAAAVFLTQAPAFLAADPSGRCDRHSGRHAGCGKQRVWAEEPVLPRSAIRHQLPLYVSSP
jgi:hypothetical protein